MTQQPPRCGKIDIAVGEVVKSGHCTVQVSELYQKDLRADSAVVDGVNFCVWGKRVCDEMD